jgi:hypothetical protein
MADDQSELPQKRDRSPPSASAAAFVLPPPQDRPVPETLLQEDSSGNAVIPVLPALLPAGGNNCPLLPYVVQETQAGGNQGASAEVDEAASSDDNDQPLSSNSGGPDIPHDWTAGNSAALCVSML